MFSPRGQASPCSPTPGGLLLMAPALSVPSPLPPPTELPSPVSQNPETAVCHAHLTSLPSV